MTSSPYPHSDRDLLHRISRSAGSKAGYKQLIRELGLGGGRERRLLLDQLSRLVAQGDLLQGEEGLWSIPRAATEERPIESPKVLKPSAAPSGGPERRSGRDRLLSGKLELHREGYGFVRLDTARIAAAGERSEDLFIPPVALHGAMHGDLVLVEEDTPRPDGKRSGRIARVLTRRNPTMVGIFHYARGAGRRKRQEFYDATPALSGDFVQPLDDRLGGPIEIPDAADHPNRAASAHRTLGDEAWRAPAGDRTEGAKLDTERWPLEGLAVEVEITQYAQPGRPARGRILEVLGPPDAFGVDVEIVIRKHGIPHTFPAHVLEEAEQRSRERPASLETGELALREDFRDLPVVTIDGETARDFDDAVLVHLLPNGNTELQVHIADVGWYVRGGSALDTEARVRGTSVYFPDRAVPMLPPALSSGMCSLLPHEDRLVLSCIMEIDARGEIVGYRVAEGLIRSARRMTYTAVQQCLNASPHAALWNERKSTTPIPSAEDLLEREHIGMEQPALPAAFDNMLQLALRLNAKRVRRGSIDFDLPEPVVQFDPDGNMKAIVRSERGWAHRLIEEFMLSANECVATWLTAGGIPSLYRIHEMPSPKRVMEFEETAAGFGQTLGIGSVPVKRFEMKSDRRDAQRRSARGDRHARGSRAAQQHELPASIPVTPQMYQKLVRRIAGTPEERILSYLMLRSLKQARYAEKNDGHFALASPCYTHFTSPIRRYPDLIVHRLLRSTLRAGANPNGGPILSDDPQPWATELARSQGKHAFQVRGDAQQGLAQQGLAQQEARLTPPSPVAPQTLDAPRLRKKRPGTIGWSGQPASDSPASAANSRHTFESSPGSTEASRGQTLDSQRQETTAPIAADELTDIAVESSQAERRAADAERELMEWKKIKFMADRVGDDFTGIILSVTKFGFFVELDELFIEGLVPLSSLTGDFYSFRDGDRTICGARGGHCFAAGQRVEVILDRIDRQARRLQFALLPGTEPLGEGAAGSLRAGRPEGERNARKAPSGGRRKAKVPKGAKLAKGGKVATPKAKRKKKS